MKKASGTGVGVGGSSILVIFILLCMTTFATLSLVSANADLRLSQKTAAATAEYYEADGQAEVLLAKINRIFQDAAEKGLTGQTYADACMRQVRELTPDSAFEVIDDQTFQIWYQVAMNDSQSVSVKLHVQPGGLYTIQEWKVVASEEWQPESDGFYLWDGGFGAGAELAAEPPTTP